MSGTENLSSVKVGTDYEKFVQAIYQTLLNEDGLGTVKVEQNKTDLVGKSGCAHQLDVYWEFQLGGQTYRTAIECKAYASEVKIGNIRDFYGVLADVPNLNGIFVTLVGFQSGAKKYADHYGISLKELREPADEDYDGRIQKIHVKVHLVMAEIKALKPKINDTFLASLKEGEEIEATFNGTNYDPYLVDSKGGSVASYEEIREALPTTQTTALGMKTQLKFQDAHIRANDGRLIAIDHIDVEYDVLVDIEDIKILGKKIARAIIKDVKSGDVKFVS